MTRFTDRSGHARPSGPRTDMDAVREVSLAITTTHQFVYLVPEAAEEPPSSA